ncbi:kinase-like domain-containing protein [Stachybotrys elegans]|uniref:EKC/KEOPS complex subunit BUD32 n=1 Tax=Stachybotrys elegans TaxID=80388 RepID=A0A8K0SG46_9HYPO|nr:kinase-like domain-containing protein [Stachybotrys elegans]
MWHLHSILYRFSRLWNWITGLLYRLRTVRSHSRSDLEQQSLSDPIELVIATKPPRNPPPNARQVGIIKSPKPNPFNAVDESANRQAMRHEALVYKRLGNCSHIPKLLEWDPELCTITLEHLANGNLGDYLREHPTVSETTRQRWVQQAAKGLEALHAAGVTHNDIAPRNFLLSDSLELRICDFASSSVPGLPVSDVAPGARYQRRPWPPRYSSVLYLIVSGVEPYSELKEKEVEARFERGEFPTTRNLDYGEVIERCWDGQTTAMEIVMALS